MWRRYVAESAREASDTTLAHGVSRGFHIADATSPVRATERFYAQSPSGRGLGEGRSCVAISTLTRRFAAPSPSGRGTYFDLYAGLDETAKQAFSPLQRRGVCASNR